MRLLTNTSRQVCPSHCDLEGLAAGAPCSVCSVLPRPCSRQRHAHHVSLRSLPLTGHWYVEANMHNGQHTHLQFNSLQAFWPVCPVPCLFC